MQVHIDTHKVTGKIEFEGKESPTYSVEVTINNDRREVACSKIENDNILIFRLAVRYPYGAKVWPGYATYRISSNKVEELAPTIGKMASVRMVGFFSDYREKFVADCKEKASRNRYNAVA